MKTISFLVIISFILLVYGCKNDVNFMASLMEMNKPEYLLKDSVFWNVNESKYNKCYSSKKVENRLIPEILDNQDRNFIHIAKLMKIDNIDTLPKINLWVFKNDHEKYLKTQVKSNAHCLTEYWSVYYNKENAKGAHEIGHLMSQHFWGYINNEKYSFLLEEGFAFYVDEGLFFKVDFYDKARKILQEEKFKISNIVNDSNNDNYNYKKKAFVCGAFNKYLIKVYGIEKFSILWMDNENDNLFHSTFDKSLNDLENEFYEFLLKNE